MRKPFIFAPLFSLLVLLFLVGCSGSVRPDGRHAAVSLEGTRWMLVELGDRRIKLSPESKRKPHLLLGGTGRKASGFGGCNNFFGSYEVEAGDRIRFSNLASTLMSCPSMKVERDFLKALELSDSYTVKDNTLKLYKARLGKLATFKAASKK
ncbi:META domain-containing protein [Prosthecochloris sp. GSB1]|uniref:META domain-containing protein n=1 Tax=Prosthecochloris sp. GSB1 TaxID=281093 RepID=UPI00142D25D0|nr:META domain-containing protein [Prosthecochloris sp. GSB1]